MKDKQMLTSIIPISAFIFILVLGVKYWDTVIKSLGLVSTVAAPIITGIVIAYILNITMSFFEERVLKGIFLRVPVLGKCKRMISILLALLSFILIISLLLLMVIPQIQTTVNTLINNMPRFYQSITDFIKEFEGTEGYRLLGQMLEESNLISGFSSANITEGIKAVANWVRQGGASGTLGILNSAIGTALNFFMGLIFAFYLLAEKENLKRQILLLEKRFLNPAVSKKLNHVAEVMNKSFHSFIVGQALEAIILGILCAIGMLLFRFPYAVMIGVMVGATAIIPIFGAFIGGAVGFVMIFTESPMQALLFVLYFNVLQQLENQLIYPKVVGSSIGLPGIWIFVSVIIGSGLFGVKGMLVFIPLVATGYQLLREKVYETMPANGKMQKAYKNLPKGKKAYEGVQKR